MPHLIELSSISVSYLSYEGGVREGVMRSITARLDGR